MTLKEFFSSKFNIQKKAQIRWGIFGTGNGAREFISEIIKIPHINITAIASRNRYKAKRFSQEFHIPKHYASYSALLLDPEVNLIYIATPHSLHLEHSTLCLNAGKSVLCEKPLTTKAADTKDIISLAREKKLFLMEAMWILFLPSIQKALELIQSNIIGEVVSFKADFGFVATEDPLHRLYNPKLGGGALLDIGTYLITFSQVLFKKKPISYESRYVTGKNNVDVSTDIFLDYGEGRYSSLFCTIKNHTAQEAVIVGTHGIMTLEAPWWRTQKILISKNGVNRYFSIPLDSKNYTYEVNAVLKSLELGDRENSISNLSQSLEVAEIIDSIKKNWEVENKR